MQPSIRREKSAIRRYSCSRPIALATGTGLIPEGSTVLDYGCGYGADVKYLKTKKFKAAGWDPHFAPDPKAKQPAQVVNLGYVLNVIEDLRERAETLRDAYSLAERLLLIAVRVDRDLEGAQEFGDGVLTNSGTFQKLYSQEEFLGYVQATLGVRPHAAALGIGLVFKDQELEREYLATKAFAGAPTFSTEQLHRFAKDPTARRLVALANTIGRVPTGEEFAAYQRLIDRYGSTGRLRRLLLRHVDPDRFVSAAQQRREDVLTFLAMLRLRAVDTPLGQLPGDVREDIRAFWPTYAAARTESETFLFSLGDAARVAAVCSASPVGKLLPKDLYVHRSAEDDLPSLLRLVVFAAKQVVGEVSYDLLKVSTDGRAVSFLSYPDFDTDPHPALASSIRIYLPKSSYDIRDYRDSLNPPVLHRKETFVSPTHPLHATFAALTRAEEEAGLLSATDIGFRRIWQQHLAERGLGLEGHALVVRMDLPAAAAEPGGPTSD